MSNFEQLIFEFTVGFRQRTRHRYDLVWYCMLWYEPGRTRHRWLPGNYSLLSHSAPTPLPLACIVFCPIFVIHIVDSTFQQWAFIPAHVMYSCNASLSTNTSNSCTADMLLEIHCCVSAQSFPLLGIRQCRVSLRYSESTVRPTLPCWGAWLGLSILDTICTHNWRRTYAVYIRIFWINS